MLSSAAVSTGAEESRPLDAAVLRFIAERFPDVEAVTAEIARLTAELALPKGSVHVLSDVHGEDVKLRHIINNASGTLRPLVEKTFGSRPRAEREELLTLLFYPAETLAARLDPGDAAQRRAFTLRVLGELLVVMKTLAVRTSIQRVERVFPTEYREIFREMLHETLADRDAAFVAAIVDPLMAQGREAQFVRVVVRAVRNLAVSEIVVAGDLFDRGPRADRVVEYLRHQPNVAFAWGNHDVAWMGAALGSDALIAHVLRISSRYRRLSQLEEGYGITLQPLEKLVRERYADDPAEGFVPHGTGLREVRTIARMQKAAAIMQFKLEGQLIARHPEWRLEHRRVLRGMDLSAGTVMIDGRPFPLKDRHLPTVDPADPEALSPEEITCLGRTRSSFLSSPLLWDHVRFLAGRGSTWLSRDGHLIFHGCVPVEEDGTFQAFVVDGRLCAGRGLFEALDTVVQRAVRERSPVDLDTLWYLWSGPRSPLFGKDRITTFERDFVAAPETHAETKNPYFRLIHEREFCERVLAEFGCPSDGLIVNGHVPVRIDAGESPVKKGGNAITIDGAFSEAYGDHGYTLLLEPHGTFLARHHHFESVQAAVRDGVDIVPSVASVREFETPRTIGDTEEGARLRADIGLLSRLAVAYATGRR